MYFFIDSGLQQSGLSFQIFGMERYAPFLFILCVVYVLLMPPVNTIFVWMGNRKLGIRDASVQMLGLKPAIFKQILRGLHIYFQENV